MDIIDENKYNEFKNILLGCKTINDAEYFADLYIKKNPETKKLVIGLLHGKKYNSNYINFHMMQMIMEKCNICQTQEEVLQIINEYFPCKDKNNDNFAYKNKINKIKEDNYINNVQYKTLIRIAKNKKQISEKEHNKNLFYRKDKSESTIVKHCPHPGCGRAFHGTNETKYVICGYENDNKGIDWYGCRRDWCFSCGKMLCKEWGQHQLHVDCNRIHDSECCKKHSIINKKIYLSDYCQCDNKYVKRGTFLSLLA